MYTVAYDVRNFARRKCEIQLTIRLRVLQRCLLDRRQQNCFLRLLFVIRQHRRLLLTSRRLRYLLRHRHLDCCVRDRSLNRQRQYHFHYLHQRRLRRQHNRQYVSIDRCIYEDGGRFFVNISVNFVFNMAGGILFSFGFDERLQLRATTVPRSSIRGQCYLAYILYQVRYLS